MRRRTPPLALALLPLVFGCAASSTFEPDASAPKDSAVDAPKDVAVADATADAPKDASSDVLDATVDALDATIDVVDAGPDVVDAGPDVLDAAPDVLDAGPDVVDAGGSSWKTPTCDGTVGANEYGPAKSTFTTGGGQAWSMTWNATNLYVAVTNATVTEAIVLYVGFGNTGLTAGQNYDGTAPGTLKFKADAVLYAKSTYNEVRKVVGAQWGAATASAATSCGNTTTRELVIPWSALGQGSIPASFRFVAYATSAGGFVYGQIPTGNPSGSIGTGMSFPNDWFVSSTNDGAGAFPFDTVE